MLVERPLPIARQVTNIIGERIRGQDYSPGERLPSENDLADELGVSRATVRTALEKLAGEGLVLRKQGDGTYINKHIVNVPTRMGAMLDYIRLIENSGYEVSTELLGSDVRRSTEKESISLKMKVGDTIIVLNRRFSANGTPVILANTLIPTTLFIGASTSLKPGEGELPIRELLWRKCRQIIAYAIINIESIRPSIETKELLAREGDLVMLKLEQTFFNNDNLPILFSESYYDDKTLGLRLMQSWG